MQSQTHSLPNVGYTLAQLTALELEPIDLEVKSIQANNYSAEQNRDYLAGNIIHEYKLVDCRSHVEQLALAAFEQHRQTQLVRPGRVVLGDLWVNYQQQHEYNPPHNHTGTASFVIWLRVPYTIEQEQNYRSGVPLYSNRGGQFCLHYVNTVGQLQHHYLPVDSTWEGCMLMFPSSMNHSVMPFYSTDSMRISVAGNLHLLP